MSSLLRGTGAFFIVLGLLFGVFFGIKDHQFVVALNLVLLGLIPGIMCISMALILDRLNENRRYLEEVLRRLPEGQNGTF
ncbi:hypothetical protein D3C76_345140 [compost metagenome]